MASPARWAICSAMRKRTRSTMDDEAPTPSEQALRPLREQTVEFYGDDVLAAQLADGTILVPLRPIADHLGLNWSGQFLRLRREPVLAEAVTVCIMQTGQGPPPMQCLP